MTCYSSRTEEVVEDRQVPQPTGSHYPSMGGPARLAKNWNGPTIRVRRASDNATRDIRLTSSGELDVESLLEFCNGGADSLYVELVRR